MRIQLNAAIGSSTQYEALYLNSGDGIITMAKITINQAKERIRGYIKKYYQEIRPDVFEWDNFRRELYGYIVSLSHNIATKRGWQGHNWRQGLRRHLLSYALNEIDKIDRKNKIKTILVKIFTLGLAKD